MQNSFDTSFIPQQPLLRVEGVARGREPINFALVLAFIMFFVSLVVAGGIYFYGLQIDKRIIESSEQLEALEKTLDSSEIALYKRVDSRITTTKALLRDHGVFTIVLDFLEQETAKNIGLTMLDYGMNNDNQITVRVKGVGPGFQSVYFQSETWKKATPFVSSLAMENITLDDETGIVSFGASVVLNPVFLKYTKMIETQGKTGSTTSVMGGNQTTP